MRVFQISSSMMMFLLVSVLFVAGCDNKDNKSQGSAPAAKGSLLESGKIPPVTAEGAAALKSELETSYYVDMVREGIAEGQKLIAHAESFGKLSEEGTSFSDNITVAGEFAVIPNGDHYKITFPNLTTFTPPEEEDDVDKVEIFHNIGLKAWPTGDPAAFRMEFVADEKPLYVVAHKDGKEYEIASLTYKGGEKFKVLWHNDFETFAKLTGNIQDVAFKVDVPEELRRNQDDIDHFSIVFSNIVSNTVLQPDKDNLWSGPLTISLENMNITLPKDEGEIKVARFALEDEGARKFSPKVYKEFFAAEDEHREMISALDGATYDPEKEFAALLRLYEPLILTLTEGFESTNLKYIIEGLDVSLRDGNGGETQDFSLDEFILTMPMSNNEQGHTNIGFGYTVKGLDAGLEQFQAELGGETPEEIVPRNMNFDMVIENLPLKEIGNRSLATVKETAGDPESFFQNMSQHYPEYINMLVEADSKLKVNDTYVGNDIWSLLVNGGTQMNPQSPLQVQGESEIRFYGMDSLLQIIQERMKSEDMAPPMRMMLQQYVQGLGMMQMFGQQSKDDDGRDYRGYNVTLSPDGSVQMNGTDMSQMMGMMR